MSIRISPPTLPADAPEAELDYCQLCGAHSGDPDPCRPGRKLRLHVEPLTADTPPIANDVDNLRVLCSACNQARSSLATPSESALNLLGRIRRAPRAVQREVYQALRRTFGE